MAFSLTRQRSPHEAINYPRSTNNSDLARRRFTGKTRRMKWCSPLCACASILLLAGCATGPRVVASGPSTYSISAEDGLRWNTTTRPAREIAFETANRYCIKRKLVMVPVSLDVHPGEIGVRTATADLVFRALPPGDPRIERSQAVFRYYDPMVVRESFVKFSPDGTVHHSSANKP